MKLKRSRAIQETVELNITAFLNLMVILVPFLLITAVFSRMTVIELSLPPANSEVDPEKKIELQLQFLIYPESIEIRDANFGKIKAFTVRDGQIPWKLVRDTLLQVKTRFPEETTIALLMDQSIPYKRLVEVMDHVRSAEVVNITEVQEVELFPDVSIGKVPDAGEGDSSVDEEQSLDVLEAKLSVESQEATP